MNLPMRILSFINNKETALLVVFFIVIITKIHAQKSPFQLNIGYEQLYVSPNTTNGIAEKSWIWTTDQGDDLFTMRTSLTQAYQMGIAYDLTKWWSVKLNFKKYYRRYYVWEGNYITSSYEGEEPGQFVIIPYVGWSFWYFTFPDMFLGATLATTSWQLGTDFHHPISRNKKWHLHYYLSLNRDLYEVNLDKFDSDVYYGGSGSYTDIHTGENVNVSMSGHFILKSKNPQQSQFRGSTNIAIAVSRALRNGMGLRLEFGLRNIRWIKDNLLQENHWELNLNHQRYIENENDPGNPEIIMDESVRHEFPLYLGGYYTNLSFTFRPFRSPRDKEDYVSPGQKIGRFLKKIF